jgi:tRNA-2-methylthio-N6-dimethylallyladenosine synthase
MADTPNVMPQLHMPLQSGSDKVLKDMKRSYRSTKFLGILDKVRERMPHAAISTDIIVGFPGETEKDFQATLDVVEKSRFATAFTFQYSKRPGTPAADLPDQLPKAVVQERFERLTDLQDRIAAEENARQLGRQVEVMVTAQSGRKAGETHRLSGRSQDQRLVHFSVPEGAEKPRPGDLVTVTITEAAAFHLVADPASAADYALRRSRAGDAWDRSLADSCGAPAPGSGIGASGSKGGVSLGMPALPVRRS